MWPHTHRPRRQWALASPRPLLRQADTTPPVLAACTPQLRWARRRLGYTCAAQSRAPEGAPVRGANIWPDVPSVAQPRVLAPEPRLRRSSRGNRLQPAPRPRRLRPPYRPRPLRSSVPAAPSCPSGRPGTARPGLGPGQSRHRRVRGCPGRWLPPMSPSSPRGPGSPAGPSASASRSPTWSRWTRARGCRSTARPI